MKATISILVVIIFAWSGNAQPKNEEIGATTKLTFFEDLTKYRCANEERLAAVQNLFAQKGASISEQKVIEYADVRNLEIIKKGRSGETIIIGAHMDNRNSCGVIDNWSGLTIMANIYAALKDRETDKTYRFVAFGREEEGLIGSKAYVKAMDEPTRRHTCAMVNFDSFGVVEAEIVKGVSSKSMIKYAQRFAAGHGKDLRAVKKPRSSTDSASFLSAGIPAVGFSGLPKDWRKYLHSINDNSRNMKNELVYDAYILGLNFSLALENEKCDSLR